MHQLPDDRASGAVTVVYVLSHVRHDDLYDSGKLLGVFASEEEARSHIPQYLNLPGFQDHPDDFCVDEYALGALHWLSGFG
jgi:hypothetical protein